MQHRVEAALGMRKATNGEQQHSNAKLFVTPAGQSGRRLIRTFWCPSAPFCIAGEMERMLQH
jgi:hypothetical protein